MVFDRWGLNYDPFLDGRGGYVATPSREEALARLAYLLDRGGSPAVVRGEEGIGKTVLIDEALRRLPTGRFRVIRVIARPGPDTLIEVLAAALGVRAGPPRRALESAARLCRIEGKGLVVAIDDDHDLSDDAEVERLGRLDPHPGARIRVVRAGRGDAEELPSWRLAIRPAPLTISETAIYLNAKAAAAGRSEPIASPRGLSRLHALADGIPARIDRLASLAIAVASLRGAERIEPGDVERAAAEWNVLPMAG